MRLAIHQPNFLPRLKVLQKLASADCWVVLDNVQFARSEWQNRARVLPAHTTLPSFWLTLPVSLPGGRGTLIKDVTVQELEYNVEHCERSIWHAFRASAHWPAISAYWDDVRGQINSNSLTQIGVVTATTALRQFSRAPQLRKASELSASGENSKLLAAICTQLSATEYLADSGSATYLRTNDFTRTHVLWQDWQEPLAVTPVLWRDLSFISFLAHQGPDCLAAHLAAGVFR